MPHDRTLVNLFESSVSRFPENPMFWEKTGERYEATSYREMQKGVFHFACALLSLGLKKGDKVALLEQARRDWVIAELGILYTGCTNVPLSVKLESSDLLFRLKHARVKVLVVSVYQYSKIKNHIQDLPDLQKIVLLDPPDFLDENELSLKDFLILGEGFLKGNTEKFRNTFESVDEEDCALISYTSGTTADPKGIMLSHKNLYVNCQQSLEMFKVEEDFRILLILPLDHSFAHTTGMYVFIASGASLASVQLGRTPAATLKNVFTNIREIKPNTLLSVPTVAKNLKKNVENGIRKKGRVVKALFSLGLKMANRYNGNGWNRGKGLRFIFWPMYKLADVLVFRQVRNNFGGRLEYFVGGGALLDIDLQKFFFAIGLPMYQGYGLSETSPVISSNTIAAHKMGSSGRIIPNLEVRICDEESKDLPAGEKGEIVVKGDNVMQGYYRNEEASREVLQNGWLYTGDMGYFDKDGFLFVLGRFKSLLIGDDGEKYSPEGIEEFIEEHSETIGQIMIYNNQDPYTTALIYPKKDVLKEYMRKKQLSVDRDEDVDRILLLIQESIDSYKNGVHDGGFPQRWLPAAIGVLSEGFTEENQFLNSSLKMVRGKILEAYRERIDYMYTPEGKNIFNSKNKESIIKILKS